MPLTIHTILQAKHWQIFLAFIILSLGHAISSIVSNILPVIFYTAYVASYIGWMLLLGRFLKEISPAPVRNYQFIVACGFCIVVLAASFRIYYFKHEMKAFDHTSALLVSALVLACLVAVAGFVARNLRAAEAGHQVGINSSINDILALLFWPIGIWFVQPRINSIYSAVTGATATVGDVTHPAISRPEKRSDNTARPVEAKTINALVGYGILVFVLGFFIGVYWFTWAQLLMPAGTLLTFTGVFLFFKHTNLATEFAITGSVDLLTYFWNVIALKWWTLVFVVWMMIMNFKLITTGFQ
jgi:hypothetical protein